MSDCLNALVRAGLRYERSVEPEASNELVAERPEFHDEQTVPQAWIVRARKAGSGTAISSFVAAVGTGGP